MAPGPALEKPVGALVLAGQKLPIIHQLYAIENSPSFFTRFFGSVLGVGLLEEGAKALPIFWIFVRQRKNATLGEIAFLGAVSGLSFGVMEAVGYSYSYAQEHAGRVVEMWERYHSVPQLFYASFVIQETTRLMSLPLLHAIWCAMASLFIAMAALVAILHGSYDAALSSGDPSPWAAFGVALLSVLLFVEYSRTGGSILERLRKEEPETALSEGKP